VKALLILTWFLHGVDGGAHTNLTRIAFASMKDCQLVAARFMEDARRLNSAPRVHILASAVCVEGEPK
jgi:hypothetical protein